MEKKAKRTETSCFMIVLVLCSFCWGKTQAHQIRVEGGSYSSHRTDSIWYRMTFHLRQCYMERSLRVKIRESCGPTLALWATEIFFSCYKNKSTVRLLEQMSCCRGKLCWNTNYLVLFKIYLFFHLQNLLGPSGASVQEKCPVFRVCSVTPSWGNLMTEPDDSKTWISDPNWLWWLPKILSLLFAVGTSSLTFLELLAFWPSSLTMYVNL